jgi:hypothetical protein
MLQLSEKWNIFCFVGVGVGEPMKNLARAKTW